jgi:hypothetical protein
MDSSRERIETFFPGLCGKAWQPTSPETSRYNCIAWAAGDTDRWWWPTEPTEDYYWPAGVECAETLAAFVAAFSLLGYAPRSTPELELGYVKIALFAAPDGIPTHASRQLANGRWTSKLGEGEDIEHDLQDIDGAIYGSVAQLMRRASAAGLLQSGDSQR